MSKIEREKEVLYGKIGERLKKIRLEKGYKNQESFAYVSDIPRAQYGRYEKGTNLTLLSLFWILSHHNISFEEFFSEGFEDLNKLMKGK